MSSLHQISCRYDAFEDRLLLSISTRDKAEYRCWLTRRFALSLINDFKVNTAKFRMAKPADPVASSNIDPKEMADFQQAADTQKGNFEKKFEPCEEFPVGEEGFLVKTITLTPKGNEKLLLIILPNKGKGINLNINKSILNNFFEVIERALSLSGWVDQNTLSSQQHLH